MRPHIARAIPGRWKTGLAAILGWLLAATDPALAQSTIQFTSTLYNINEAAEAVSLAVQRLNETDTAVPRSLRAGSLIGSSPIPSHDEEPFP